MRLIRLAGAVVALSVSWAVSANPALNSNVSGSIAGPAAATTHQIVANQAQARLERSGLTGNLASNLSGKDPRTISERAAGTDESRGWLMALVAILLIGHQLRRKHRFLRPQRFSDL